MTDDFVSGVLLVDQSEIGKSRHLPSSRGACAPLFSATMYQ